MKTWMVFLLPVVLLAGGLVPRAMAQEKYILIDDVDDWHAEMFCGSPNVRHFIQGPKLVGGAAGVLAFDSRGNAYAACGTFIQIVTADGQARILAGTPGVKGASDGPPWKATFGNAADIVMPNDKLLYVVDNGNMTLRKLEKKRDGLWITQTVAGVPGEKGHRDGQTHQALFTTPFDGVAVDEKGVVYVMSGNWLRKIEDGKVTTLNAGTGTKDGPLSEARFNQLMGGNHVLSYDGKGNLFMADRWSMSIRKVDLKKKMVSTVAGVRPGEKRGAPADGPAFEARFHRSGGPGRVFCNPKHGFLLVNAADEYNRIRAVFPEEKILTFGPNPAGGRRGAKGPLVGPWRKVVGGITCGVDADGNVYVGGSQCIRVVKKKK